MKAHWGMGGKAPRVHGLDTRWRWVVSFTPRPLYPQVKSPWYPSYGRLGGPSAGQDAVARRTFPNPYRDSNPRSSSPWNYCYLELYFYVLKQHEKFYNLVKRFYYFCISPLSTECRSVVNFLHWKWTETIAVWELPSFSVCADVHQRCYMRILKMTLDLRLCFYMSLW